MDRRFLLAVTLMIAVLALPSLFMKRPARPAAPADSAQVQVAAGDSASSAAPRPAGTPVSAPPVAPATPSAPAGPDTASVSDSVAGYRFSAAGGVLVQATLPRYTNHHPGDSGAVRLFRRDGRMLAHTLILDSDTLRFGAAPHVIERLPDGLRLTAQVGAVQQALTVTPVAGHPYLLDLRADVTGLDGRGALLLVDLGDGFANVDGDSLDNYRNYAVAVRRGRPDNTNFRSLDPGEVEQLAGPFDWVAVKSKYFIGALLSADSTRPQIGGAVLTGMPREGKNATRMATRLTMPVGVDGRIHYQLYLGPQTQRTLKPLGRELDQASPYGWIFRPIVMPVAGWITQLFLWMHENLSLSFGMVLVVFGVLVRLVLWPLNTKAMKSQVAMMAVQPILKDLQARHKNDPQRLQSEMMKVYKEHNVNPLGGCLPMLLPMPVLLALFFVFMRAIELRGTPFLWLPDLSMRDPLFITPLVMGLSMYALSKLSQQGMPPNPQAKMMTIFMPIMMTVLFLNFASGLNLYYAVSNIVSLPQQWLINRSRQAEMDRRKVAKT